MELEEVKRLPEEERNKFAAHILRTLYEIAAAERGMKLTSFEVKPKEQTAGGTE